jgi:hypothetical protein
MLNVPADLRTRAEVAYAHLVVDDIEPSTAIVLAGDLVVAGIDCQAVKNLATQSAVSLGVHDAEQLLRAMLDEVGVPEPDVPTAAELATGDICARLLDGTLSVERGGHRLLGTLSQEKDQAGLTLLLHLLDELEYDLRGDSDDDWRENLLNLARALTVRPKLSTLDLRGPESDGSAPDGSVSDGGDPDEDDDEDV